MSTRKVRLTVTVDPDLDRLLAEDGDDIVTSDAGDLRPLAAASGRHVELLRP